jgi:hypothetical protein
MVGNEVWESAVDVPSFDGGRAREPCSSGHVFLSLYEMDDGEIPRIKFSSMLENTAHTSLYQYFITTRVYDHERRMNSFGQALGTVALKM